MISNPASFETVIRIAAQGERVPRKSTSFGPKPRTGLVLRTFGPSDYPRTAVRRSGCGAARSAGQWPR